MFGIEAAATARFPGAGQSRSSDDPCKVERRRGVVAAPAVGGGDWRDGHRGFRGAVVPGDGHHRLDEANREEQHREKELHQTRADNRRKGTDKSLQGYGIGITRQIEKKRPKSGGQTADC